MAIVDVGASFASKAWGKVYTARVAAEFGIPDRGVVVGPGRGSYNVRFAKCQAILVEPGFVDTDTLKNARRVFWVISPEQAAAGAPWPVDCSRAGREVQIARRGCGRSRRSC